MMCLWPGLQVSKLGWFELHRPGKQQYHLTQRKKSTDGKKVQYELAKLTFDSAGNGSS